VDRSYSILALSLAALLLAPSTFTQSPPPVQTNEPRSVVRLLPGYTAQDRDGIDTASEQIWKGEFKFSWV
jgi:hypothetical protein